jgi:pimeloyl-ACP methyl ester carboxylesterase
VPKVTLSSGVRLHYQQIGDGPDLVMIHGLTGNLAVWHLQIIPMISHRYRTLTYDLRGHGYSDVTPSGYSCDQMAADLRELLDMLEIERAPVVGHSFGGDISLYFALNYPDRVSQVIAIEPALPAMIYLRDRDEWEGWDYWVTILENSGHSVPPERRTDVDYLLRASLQVPKKWGPLKGLPRNPKPFLRLIDETTIAAEYEEVGTLTVERIPTITTPVVLMYAAKSAFLGTHDYLLEHIPTARSIILPRTELGHFGPLEQPDVVAEHIVATLDDRELATEAVGE